MVSNEVNSYGSSPNGDIFFISVFVTFIFDVIILLFVGRVCELGFRIRLLFRVSVCTSDYVYRIVSYRHCGRRLIASMPTSIYVIE